MKQPPIHNKDTPPSAEAQPLKLSLVPPVALALPAVLPAEFMVADLKRSGLEPADLAARPNHGFITGYRIPYFTLDGLEHPTMYRDRLNSEQRYSQPPVDGVKGIGDAARHPYIPPAIHTMDCHDLIIAEGEKKAASIIKHLARPAIGIGGAGNWRDSSGKSDIHKVILALLKLRGVKRVTIVPDGDVRRYDLATEYGTLAAQLRHEGYEVLLLSPPGKIDDLIVKWGVIAPTEFSKLRPVPAEELVENVDSLITRYDLGFATNGKGARKAHQNEANVGFLLDRHPSFPKIWYDADASAVMFNAEVCLLDQHMVRVLKFFQHNLHMSGLDAGTVKRAVTAQAFERTRHPFREWLEQLEWDGVPRLETMFIRLCGTPDTPFSREAGRKWLTGAVWRTMEPGCPVDYMLVSQGAQGIGKSTFPKLLFGDKYVVAIVGREMQSKDEMTKYHMGKCISFEEFDQMYTTNIGHMKGVITNARDTFRKPYSADTQSHPRRCIFYASTNQSRFLKQDETGQRRFVVLAFTQLAFTQLQEQREQLWAEAVVRWRTHAEAATLYSLSEISGATEEAKKHVNEETFTEVWDEAVENLRNSDSPLKKNGYLVLGTMAVYTMAGLDGHMRSKEACRLLKDHMERTGWKFYDQSPSAVTGTHKARQRRVWVLPL